MATDDSLVRRVPPHLVPDFEFVAARPIKRRRVRLRNVALRRFVSWWLDEDRYDYAAKMLRVHRTALKASVVGGASYRAARSWQDEEENGRRISRGKTWD